MLAVFLSSCVFCYLLFSAIRPLIPLTVIFALALSLSLLCLNNYDELSLVYSLENLDIRLVATIAFSISLSLVLLVVKFVSCWIRSLIIRKEDSQFLSNAENVFVSALSAILLVNGLSIKIVESYLLYNSKINKLNFNHFYGLLGGLVNSLFDNLLLLVTALMLPMVLALVVVDFCCFIFFKLVQFPVTKEIKNSFRVLIWCFILLALSENFLDTTKNSSVSFLNFIFKTLNEPY